MKITYVSIGYIPFGKRDILLRKMKDQYFVFNNRTGIERHIFICFLGVFVVLRLSLNRKYQLNNMQIKLTIGNKEVDISDELREKLEDIYDVEELGTIIISKGTKKTVMYLDDKQVKKLRAIVRVKDYIAEHFGVFEPDWDNKMEAKYHFYYNTGSGKFKYEIYYNLKNYSPIGHLRTAEHCEQLKKDCKEDLEIIFK